MPFELNSDQVEWVVSEVSDYIHSQRDHFAGQCKPLTPKQRAAMHGFFSEEALVSVRAGVLAGERIENPAFYKNLRAWGIVNLPDFSEMAAITLVDVIVSHVPFDDQLLFHELVHVMQYRALGRDEFARRYVHGFLNGGCYENIPLEMQAYELDGRFAGAPEQVFPVEQEVDRRLKEGRL